MYVCMYDTKDLNCVCNIYLCIQEGWCVGSLAVHACVSLRVYIHAHTYVRLSEIDACVICKSMYVCTYNTCT